MPRQNDDSKSEPQVPAAQWRPAKLILDDQVLSTGHVNLATKTFRPTPWRPLNNPPILEATVLLLETQQTIQHVKVSPCRPGELHYHLEIP